VSHAGLATRELGGQRRELTDGCWYLALDRASELLARRCAALREALVEVSDEAFGTSTVDVWRERFSGGYLDRLQGFYLMFDEVGALIGWAGHRARTIHDERMVYFDSSGMRAAYQGRGLLPRIQRATLDAETSGRTVAAVNLVARTRSPLVYRLITRTFGESAVVPTLAGIVPEPRRGLVTEVARWLDQRPFDAATARITGAYQDRPGLYGAAREPRCEDARVNQLFETLAPTDALLLFATQRRT